MPIKSVAVIGAGASGAITAVSLAAENSFDKIRVFERRSTAGGTWNYDPNPSPMKIVPGALPPEIDPPVQIPKHLPTRTKREEEGRKKRFIETPIYEGLSTNVPDVAMSFSDVPFAYGPFVPHYVSKQYIESYFSWHRTDDLLCLRTTVERLTPLPGQRWKLVLRKERGDGEDWWEEEFDAVVVCTGHYSVPYVPDVKGLAEWKGGRVVHSKIYRGSGEFDGARVLVVGNSASAYDISHQLLEAEEGRKVFVSRRSKARWEGKAPEGIEFLPVISRFGEDGGIVFEDGSVLRDVDVVIYCTGYTSSYPFWNVPGRDLWSYGEDVLLKNYQHTFVQDFPTLAFVGIPRVLTFRSFEYQAIAIARYFAERNVRPMPCKEEQEKWFAERKEKSGKFHQIDWSSGETMEWFKWLYEFAGLPLVEGGGRCPPVLGRSVRWAIENVNKYPEWGPGEPKEWEIVDADEDVVERKEGGQLWFI